MLHNCIYTDFGNVWHGVEKTVGRLFPNFKGGKEYHQNSVYYNA
jgi:hypothetical protein